MSSLMGQAVHVQSMRVMCTNALEQQRPCVRVCVGVQYVSISTVDCLEFHFIIYYLILK